MSFKITKMQIGDKIWMQSHVNLLDILFAKLYCPLHVLVRWKWPEEITYYRWDTHFTLIRLFF